MSEAKSKRDQIWEEKRRQREERLLRMEGQMQENNANSFLPPSYKFEEQIPVSFPTNQEYAPYIPPEPILQQPERNWNQQQSQPYQNNQQQLIQEEQRDLRPISKQQQFSQPPILQASPLKNPIKQQQDDYREYLKKQMEEKEFEKKRKRDGNQNQVPQQSNQIFQQNSAPLPPQPVNRQKQEYGDYLRQQMLEKENQKKQRTNVESNIQQPYQQQQQFNQPIQQNYQHQSQYQDPPQNQLYYQQQQNNSFQNPQIPQNVVDNSKIQKQEYGDYLRMQMQLKEQEKNDRKKNLQQKMETGDAFPFGKAGAGAPNQRMQQNQPINNNPIQQQPMYQQQMYQQSIQQQYQQQPPYQQNQQVYQQNYNDFPQQSQPIFNDNIQQNFNQFDQQQNAQEIQGDVQIKAGRNRLQLENANLDEVKKKEQQKLEMQKVLQQQIEEKKRKKEQERQQKEMEDKIEEERFRKQLEQEEMDKKRGEDQKKQQQGKFEQDNIDLQEKKRLERIQERKNRRNQTQNPEENNFAQNVIAESQQQNQYVPPSRNLPPSQPKSENYLQNFLMNEKMKEGVSPHQSIVDFYRNGPMPVNKVDVQQAREIEEIKRQMLQQQESLQQQIQQVMNSAQTAIEGRNRAEQELISLKEQVKNKYLQEERHHDDLMVALVKNDPKWEKQVFPPHLLAQAQVAEYRDLSMPPLKENFNLPNSYQNKVQQFAPAYESKPIIMKEESKEQKIQFREQFGLQSLVSDSNMVPIDSNASLIPQIQQIQNKPSEPQLDKIDEMNAHFEDSLRLGGETYQIDLSRKRPQSNTGQQHQSWNVPSIDSEFVREIDDLMKYKPAQQTLNRPPSGLTKQGTLQQTNQYNLNNNRPPSSTNARPPSTFGRVAQGVLGSKEFNYKGITLDSEFPDLTMIKKGTNTDTLDIAGIHKKMDQKLLQLGEIEEDEDLQKLDKLLYQYNQ